MTHKPDPFGNRSHRRAQEYETKIRAKYNPKPCTDKEHRTVLLVTLLTFVAICLLSLIFPTRAQASGLGNDGTAVLVHRSESLTLTVYDSPCVLYGQIIPETRLLVAERKDASTLRGCIGVMQGTPVGLFEPEDKTSGEVVVVNLSLFPFVKTVGV